MLRPQDIKENVDLVKLCDQIDTKLKETSLKYKDRVDVILYGEYSKEVRDIIAEKYKSIGWSEVIHRTSSENGERPGLTAFEFYY